MADPQDRPDETPAGASGSSAPGGDAAARPSPSAPPPAKKAPAKAAKKAPAKKAPAKKAPAKVAKGTPPAKKAPAKKAVRPAGPPNAVPLAETNGAGDLLSAAKETAAQAKSTVESASNPVSGPPPARLPAPGQSRVPIAAALVAGLLAIVAVIIVRRRAEG